MDVESEDALVGENLFGFGTGRKNGEIGRAGSFGCALITGVRAGGQIARGRQNNFKRVPPELETTTFGLGFPPLMLMPTGLFPPPSAPADSLGEPLAPADFSLPATWKCAQRDCLRAAAYRALVALVRQKER